MAILVLLEARAKATCVAELKTLMQAALPDTRTFDGCHGLTAHVNLDDSQDFVFVEQWASREAYQRYLAWRTDNGTLGQLLCLLEGPPTIRYFDLLAV